MIYIGSDHAGFALKRRVITYLDARGIACADMGPFTLVKGDDYPDFCIPVAEAVAKHRGSMGIVIGGSGIGESIAANKVKGARAAVVYDSYTAKMSRLDNDANVIALRARGVPVAASLRLLRTWLDTPFSGAARHKRRVRKLARYER